MKILKLRYTSLKLVIGWEDHFDDVYLVLT